LHVHILGICGTLMGSIALLAKQLGHEVSGSDENVYPPMSTQLDQAGIRLSEGYRPEHIPAAADIVLIGNANLPRGNPAVEHVLDRGIAYTSGAEWLGRYLLPGRWVIAVAGTHGKTTTSAMTAWILESAGLALGFLIGGVPVDFPASARLGESDFFVIEADEYDTSYFDRRSKFLHYRPRTAILGNLEFDHADIFPDLDAIAQQFHLLVRTIPASGLIVHPAADDNLENVFARGCWTPRLAFDINGSSPLTGALMAADGSSFSVTLNGNEAGRVSWGLTGRHNVMNALAAIGAARHAGVPPALACEALSEFHGVRRRMEQRYAAPDFIVYDDFAHHPTAIETTLAGLRQRVGPERILAVIEPGSHTMRGGYHRERLGASAADADEVIWFRPPSITWDMSRLPGTVLDDVTLIVDRIVAAREDGIRHVVIMSNSGFGHIHEKLETRLEAADSKR